MPRQPRGFRLQSKNIFLTYPRCPLDKDAALQLIRGLRFPIQPAFVRVCREEHEDGDGHLHVLLQFNGKFDTRDERFFDLVDTSNGNHFHPNIQGARSSSDVAEYVAKGGDYVDHGVFRVDGRSSRGTATAVAEVYAAALNAETKEESLRIIREKDPRSYYLQFHNISANADRLFQQLPEPYISSYGQSSFNAVPDELEEWAADNVTHPSVRPDRPRSLVLEGDTRTGKTQWARSLGPHNYLCGHLDLSPRVYSNDAWYNVVDDVDPHYLKHFKEFMGAQKNWQSNTKYGKPRQITGGIPCIFLCNPGPGSSYSEFLDEEKNRTLKTWALGNATFHYLYAPLWNTDLNSPQPEADPCQSQAAEEPAEEEED